MARVDEDPVERDKTPLRLECNFECEVCDCLFDWVFTCQDGVFDREDLTDVPKDDVTCPNCGDKREREWEGWHAHEDAG